MAQGSAKLNKTKKSAGSQKRKVVTKKTQLSKGRKEYATKGRKRGSAQEEKDTTKAINKRIEAIASAKAVGAGTCFFLNEIKELGKSELKKQHQQRTKKENNNNANKLTDRMKDQLRKVGHEM